MKVIEPAVEIYREPDHFRKIETIARVCTGTQDKVGSNPDFLRNLLNLGHGTPFEHVRVKVDRLHDPCPECPEELLLKAIFGNGNLDSYGMSYRICGRTEKVLNPITGRKRKEFFKTLNGRDYLAMGGKLEQLKDLPEDDCYLTVKFSIDLGIARELIRHRQMSFCLSGDTVIKSFHGEKEWTIKELYEWQFDKKRKGRIKLINIRSVDESSKLIIRNRIKRIYKTGEKECFLLKTKSGREIKATAEHAFFTPDGYKKLSDLAVGGFVYSNGVALLDNEEWIRDHYLTKNMTRKAVAALVGCCESTLFKAFKKFGIFKPWSDRPNRHAGKGRKGAISEEGRKRLSELRGKNEKSQWWKGDNINNSGGYGRTHRWFKKECCAECGCHENLEFHHVDKNPKNNEPGNIVVLCTKHHKAWHGYHTLCVFKDEITSIESVGVETVYDIEMVDDPHNFVANGICVHNCERSTRYAKWDKDVEFVRPLPFEWAKSIKTIEQFLAIGDVYDNWLYACNESETQYHWLLHDLECSPQEARTCLNLSAATVLYVTGMYHQWADVLNLRLAKGAHPSMRYIMRKLIELPDFPAEILGMVDTEVLENAKSE